MSDPRSTALVLSGGGARGAYQAGVLAGMAEHGFLGPDAAHFDILVGSSAGSINAATLASRTDDLHSGIERLQEVWRSLHAEQVYRTDLASLGRTGVRWAWDLTFGGVTGHVGGKSLLDTTPLAALLREQIRFERIADNIEAGRLRALAVIATDLHTSNGVVFLQAASPPTGWTRRRWRIVDTDIRAEHVMASSAIPIFFPPVGIDGRWYGDGSIRNTAPLAPAIHLGAERIVAIGVSGPPPPGAERKRRSQPPTIAEVAGVLLDAVMLDALEVDVEHGERVNTSVIECPTGNPAQPFRLVEILWLRPSERIRDLAAGVLERVPPAVRYLMRGLGPDESITELASYLLFEPEFCSGLIELGRSDVEADQKRIAAFFAGGARALTAGRGS
jgi:NTE family protein